MTRATYTRREVFRIHWKTDGTVLSTERKQRERNGEWFDQIHFLEPDEDEPGMFFPDERAAWNYWDAAGYGAPKKDPRCPVEVKPMRFAA